MTHLLRGRPARRRSRRAGEARFLRAQHGGAGRPVAGPCNTREKEVSDMEKGRLFVVEGLDGSGKATQTSLLCDYLRQKGQEYRQISFPDYEDPSSTLVQMYLHGEMGGLHEVNPYGASLFFTVDRYASFCRHWRKDYEAGKIIVADRYSTSNIPHQMSRLPREEWDNFLLWLSDVEYHRVGLPKPDAVVYLDVAPEVSRRLLSERYHGDESKRDIHEADFVYLQHCRDAALYGAENQGWRIISCTANGEMLPREEITQAICKTLGI